MSTEDKIRELLDLFSLEDLFEHLDITPECVLEILLDGGHVQFPPYLEDTLEEDE